MLYLFDLAAAVLYRAETILTLILYAIITLLTLCNICLMVQAVDFALLTGMFTAMMYSAM